MKEVSLLAPRFLFFQPHVWPDHCADETTCGLGAEHGGIDVIAQPMPLPGTGGIIKRATFIFAAESQLDSFRIGRQ